MTALPWLETSSHWFPDPETALDDPDGLLAVGGDLHPDRIRRAYANGIFPWFSDEQPILWWSPNPRCVLFPPRVHIARSLKRTLNSGRFRISVDQAFEEVIHYCGAVREEGTWITEDMADAYIRLHYQGQAHSFEAWDEDGNLAGGLYGVAIGRCFFGESMFSRQRDASKVVFVHVARQLEQWGYRLMDCQVENPHLMRLGAELIPRSRFLSIIRENVVRSPDQTHWRLDWHWSPEAG